MTVGDIFLRLAAALFTGFVVAVGGRALGLRMAGSALIILLAGAVALTLA